MTVMDRSARLRRAVGLVLGGTDLSEAARQEDVGVAQVERALRHATRVIDGVVTSTPEDITRVGLSLSGGGFRAAGFHLGVVDVMARVGLLLRVKVLSTVSGGSILAGGWIAALHRGHTFERFFTDFAGWMRRTHVVDEALRRVADAAQAGEPISLIRGAASVYAQDAHTGTLTFGELRDDLPFEDLMINASEFHSGNVFRLTRTRSARARFGNRTLTITHEQAQSVRLADAVAASSCFPGAFEPLWWPSDFPGVDAPKDGPRVGLMDGGILDNQGLASLERARLRHISAKTPLDLLVISDVHQRQSDFIEEGSTAKGTWSLEALGALVVFAALGLLALGLSTLVTLGALSPLGWSMAVLTALPLAALLAVTALAAWGLGQYPGDGALPGRALRSMTVATLARFVYARVTSLVAIVANLFMKRARDQNYDQLRAVIGQEVRWMRVSINDHETGGTGIGEKLTSAMRTVCQEAFATPTTLWCKPDELRTLIAAGQISTCARLREVFATMEHDGGSVDPATAQALDVVWQRLAANPYALVDERLPAEGPTGPA